MRKIALFMAVLVAARSPALAGTLIPITPPPHSVGTHVTEINDQNIIAGAFITADGIEHGFIGPLNGTTTVFDDGDGTEPTGLSNNGYIVGFEPSDNCNAQIDCHEFVRAPDGTFTMITKDGVPIVGTLVGINRKKILVGDYVDQRVTKGYTGKKDHYLADISLQAPHVALGPTAINDYGDIAGYYLNAGTEFGFLLSNGTESIVQFPDAQNTLIWGISDKRVLVGSWRDASGDYHPFYYNSETGVFTEISVPGSQSTVAKGVNSAGLIALYTVAAAQSYIYCPKKRTCPGSGISVGEREIHASAYRVHAVLP